MRGGAGMGRVGFKKSKPIPTPPRGTGLKSPSIPAPLLLQGEKNPRGMKWGRVGQAGRRGAKLPSLFWCNDHHIMSLVLLVAIH